MGEFQLCGTIDDEGLKSLDKAKWIKEPKIDGMRIMAIVDGIGKKVKLLDRGGNDKAKQFPEIVNELKMLNDYYVLDGEIQAGGSFIKTMERAQEESNFKIKMKARQDGAIFYVFDILQHGNELIGYEGFKEKPLIDRKLILDEIFCSRTEGYHIRKVGYVRADWEDSKEWETNEGFVLKRLDGKYVPNDRTNWLKWKRKQTGIFKVIGDEMGKENLILTTEYGRVSVPRKEDIDFFFKQAPFSAEGNIAGKMKLIISLRAKIEFMEMSEDCKFRQPIFKGFVV